VARIFFYWITLYDKMSGPEAVYDFI